MAKRLSKPDENGSVHVSSPKDWKQCQYKFVHLKKDFMAARNNNNKSGQRLMKCNDYGQLVELLGNRPKNTAPNQFGFNTSSQQPAEPAEEEHTSAISKKKCEKVNQKQSQPPKYRSGHGNSYLICR